jgi:DNA-binding transcriptional ArsR family regulator
MLTPLTFMKNLADSTRMSIVLLVQNEGSLCVCELTHVLGLSQPKISRHLAQLRSSGVLQDSRQGQWVYYALTNELPNWASQILGSLARAEQDVISRYHQRLVDMPNRPDCCN